MPTDVLTPASSPSGVDAFLSQTLATLTPAEPTPAAPASASTVPSAPPTGVPPTAPSSEPVKSDASEPTLKSVQKQLGDQTKANKRLGRENLDLKRRVETLTTEMKELRAKLDGTPLEPTGPTPEQERALIEYNAREAASRKVAEEQYGAEVIQQKIFAEDSPYRHLIGEFPWVHQRVLGSETPVLEALDALEEHQVLSQFGRTSKAVLENVEQAVKDKLWKEWTAQMTTAPPQSGKPVATLGDVRGDAARKGDTKPVSVFDVRGFSRHIP